MGTISVDRTYITTSSGQLNLLYGPGENYVSDYRATADDSPLGIVGVPTGATQMPTKKSATYVGNATVEIVDGTSLYDLTGTSSVSVDFANSTMNEKSSSLGGTKTDGTSKTSVTDVAVVKLSGAKIVNSGFSGGTVKIPVSSSSLSPTLSGSQVVYNFGNFFGPSGQELGGLFLVDDRGSGTLLLQGDYLGK